MAQANGRLQFPQGLDEPDSDYNERLAKEIAAIVEAYGTAKALLLGEGDLGEVFSQTHVAAGFTVKTYSDGNVYEGEVNAAGEHQGKGVYTTIEGERYEGFWIGGKRAGNGVYTWPNGEKYEGGWLDNEMTGPGTYSWPDGRVYKGFWMMGEPCSRGTVYHPDGSVEQGEWIDGEFKGLLFPVIDAQAVIVSRDFSGTSACARDLGNVIEFKRRLLIRFTNGASYDGDVDELERFDGSGLYKWADGTTYHGAFVAGVITGYGKLIWEDGSTFEGYFVDGVREGKGITRWTSGAEQECFYKSGKIINSGKVSWQPRSQATSWLDTVLGSLKL